MERVSVLLGHSSIKVTEKHYSPPGVAGAAGAARSGCEAELAAALV